MSVIQKDVLGLVRRCRYEISLDNQVTMLVEINKTLPAKNRIRLPSLITNDYVARALDVIEESYLAG